MRIAALLLVACAWALAAVAAPPALTPANGGPVRSGGEQGLLGLAFHPSYASNGRFFVFYTRTRPGDSGGNDIVIERYTRSAGNADIADPASAFP